MLDQVYLKPTSGTMSYSEALNAIKHGRRIRRVGWNGKGMYVFILPGEQLRTAIVAATGIDLPVVDFFCIKTASDKVGQYVASACDQLANDWEVVHE